ncbi:MAG TPA: ribosome recycling factor [Chloroflexota bacterium]|nr:ribosome recycling factor [Chloroflexota bacterium]
MVSDVVRRCDECMHHAETGLSHELGAIRTGRASPALLDRIRVDYYGTPTPIPQVAAVSTPESRLLVIQPWDRQVIGAIEKAILKSDLGLTPTNDGKVVRLAIPTLTEERRKELVKMIRRRVEEGRVVARNCRRDAVDELKKLEKDHKISEDESRRGQERLQKETDRIVAELDHHGQRKEQEVLEV